MSYKITTLAERPALASQIEPLGNETWPTFLRQNRVNTHLLERVLHSFPQYQLVICDDNQQLVALGLSVPFLWSGRACDLPEGWVSVIQQSVLELENEHSPRPTTLAAISVLVAPFLRGQGTSRQLLQGLRQLASSHGLSRLVAPVRPSLKHRYPLTPMESYLSWTREDGSPFDPWVRIHAHLGARILKIAPQSTVITGTVQEWETWTGMRFPQSGVYILPEALVPLTISCERNEGRYEEPEIWMEHTVLTSAQ